MIDAVPTIWQRLYHTRLRDLIRGRFDASLDWRLAVAEADLPAEIRNCIEQVIRQTRLWRSERAEIAAELVAHFQDGLTAGRAPAELLKSFGDPQQAALLIRRSKKRGRSLAWQLWCATCLAVGALVIAYVAAGLYMAMDRPSINTDYVAVLNERAASVPEAQRAWPLYRDALLEMGVKPAEYDPNQPFASAATSKPGDAGWAKTEEYLHEHAASLAKLREAAGRAQLGFVTATSHAAFSEEDRQLFGVAATPKEIEAQQHQTVEDRWAISMLLPYLNLLKPAASLLASDARLAAQAGDGAKALDDIGAIYRISRHCEEMPTMVSEFAAEGIQRQARAAIRDVMRDHPDLWTNAQLRDLAHLTAAEQLDWRRGFVGERVCFHDSMQRVYTDDGNGDGRLALNVARDKNLFELLNAITTMVGSPASTTPLSNSMLATLAMPAANLTIASRKEMTDLYERISDLALKRLDMPLWEIRKSPSLDEELLAMQRGPLGKFRYLFVNLLLPAYDAVLHRYATSQGEREGVLIGLALELYHREHGKWPTTLAELSPRWLPELPVDRLTGEPLKYKVVDDRPVVYSVGVDGDDDSLALTDEADGVEFPKASPVSGQIGAENDVERDGDWIIWSVRKNN